MKKNKYLFSLVAVLILLPAIYFQECAPTKQDTTVSDTQKTENGQLCIKYIDVGQGDSEFIMLPNGETILIDAGEKGSGKKVVSAIKDMSVDKIDYLIATHPHADHIGGMPEVIDSFDIGKVYMPRADYSSKTYLTVLEKIDEKNLKITAVKTGTNVISSDELSAEFIAPASGKYNSLNDFSAVLKLTYGDTSFLFTGDAEANSEQEMLESGFDLSADILKVGHHGSDTSSSEKFLDAVSPEYAVISCGLNNDYSHPSENTLDKLSAINTKVFRTDKMGTITVYSDGHTINIESEK